MKRPRKKTPEKKKDYDVSIVLEMTRKERKGWEKKTLERETKRKKEYELKKKGYCDDDAPVAGNDNNNGER